MLLISGVGILSVEEAMAQLTGLRLRLQRRRHQLAHLDPHASLSGFRSRHHLLRRLRALLPRQRPVEGYSAAVADQSRLHFFQHRPFIFRRPPERYSGAHVRLGYRRRVHQRTAPLGETIGPGSHGALRARLLCAAASVELAAERTLPASSVARDRGRLRHRDAAFVRIVARRAEASGILTEDRRRGDPRVRRRGLLWRSLIAIGTAPRTS